MTATDIIGSRVSAPIKRMRGEGGFDEFYLQKPDEQRFGYGHAPNVVEIGTGRDRIILPIEVLQTLIDDYREHNAV